MNVLKGVIYFFMSLSAEPCCCCATLFVLGARRVAKLRALRSHVSCLRWLTGACACACFLFLVRSFACILSTGTLLLVSGGPVYISSLLASLPTRRKKRAAQKTLNITKSGGGRIKESHPQFPQEPHLGDAGPKGLNHTRHRNEYSNDTGLPNP